jgi:CRP-like cAMP-binding protein
LRPLPVRHRLSDAQQPPDFGQFVKANALFPLDQRGWLAAQPAEFRAWIADNGRWHHYSAGQVLYDAEDEPDAVYGLGGGALEITLPLVGDEPVVVHRAEPGFWIGESALLARARRGISVAVATESRVFRVPSGAVRRLVAEQPDAWEAFYQLSHINAMTAVRLLAEVLSLRPRARLARMILRLADEDDRVVVRQDDLARLLGMTRSSLQRALASLIEAGAVAPGYGHLDVRERARLEEISRES